MVVVVVVVVRGIGLGVENNCVACEELEDTDGGNGEEVGVAGGGIGGVAFEIGVTIGCEVGVRLTTGVDCPDFGTLTGGSTTCGEWMTTSITTTRLSRKSCKSAYVTTCTHHTYKEDVRVCDASTWVVCLLPCP